MIRTSCTNDRLPFICELQCAGPTCPAASGCVKNVKAKFLVLIVYQKQVILNQASLFGADGKVKGLFYNPEGFPFPK
jgi:hypothetical protein